MICVRSSYLYMYENKKLKTQSEHALKFWFCVNNIPKRTWIVADLKSGQVADNWVYGEGKSISNSVMPRNIMRRKIKGTFDSLYQQARFDLIGGHWIF